LKSSIVAVIVKSAVAFIAKDRRPSHPYYPPSLRLDGALPLALCSYCQLGHIGIITPPW
jgi:hypothetical protein